MINLNQSSSINSSEIIKSISNTLSLEMETKAYVFVCLQGLSIIPDVAHAVSINSTNKNNNTAAFQHQQQQQLTSLASINKAAKLLTTLSKQDVDENDEDAYDGHMVSLSNSVGNISLNNNNNNNAQTAKCLTKLPTRKQSSSSSTTSSSASSSSDSSSNNFDDCDDNNENNNNDNNSKEEFVYFDEIAEQPNSLLVKFKCSLSDEKEVEWKTLLVNGVLYVDIPSNVLPKGSRDSFVSLLEFAEDKLECHKVLVCFKRNRPDRTSLMRVFMFFGFTVVAPGTPLVHKMRKSCAWYTTLNKRTKTKSSIYIYKHN